VIFGKTGDTSFFCAGRNRKILRAKRGAISKQRKHAAPMPKPEAGDTYAGRKSMAALHFEQPVYVTMLGNKPFHKFSENHVIKIF